MDQIERIAEGIQDGEISAPDVAEAGHASLDVGRFRRERQQHLSSVRRTILGHNGLDSRDKVDLSRILRSSDRSALDQDRPAVFDVDVQTIESVGLQDVNE